MLVVTLPQPEEPRSLRDQIRLLDGAGLEAAEIARIIGRPRTTVTSEVAKVRAKKRDNKNSGRKE